jgi:flagellar hook-associated protein 2
MVQNRISFGGLASGLDTNAIIDALMEVQRRPIFTQEVRREDTLQKKQAVGSSFSTLLGSMGALKLASTFTSQATSVLTQGDDVNKIQATADGSAALGSFDVEVSQIATATTARSATPVGEAINSAVPLDQAGFIDGFAAGTFTIDSTEFTVLAATSTTIDSASAIGTGVDRTALLNAAVLSHRRA